MLVDWLNSLAKNDAATEILGKRHHLTFVCANAKRVLYASRGACCVAIFATRVLTQNFGQSKQRLINLMGCNLFDHILDPKLLPIGVKVSRSD